MTLFPPSHTRLVQVHATILMQNLHVIYEAEEIKALDFGHIYFGNSISKTVQLLNDGPTTLTFSAQCQHPESDKPGPIGKAAWHVSPANGVIPEFGSLPVTITFSPPVYEEKKGFVCTRNVQDMCFPVSIVCAIDSEELQPAQMINVGAVVGFSSGIFSVKKIGPLCGRGPL